MLDGKAKSDFSFRYPLRDLLFFRANARLGDRAAFVEADDGNRDRQRRAGAGIAGADEIIQLAVLTRAAASMSFKMLTSKAPGAAVSMACLICSRCKPAIPIFHGYHLII